MSAQTKKLPMFLKHYHLSINIIVDQMLLFVKIDNNLAVKIRTLVKNNPQISC